MVKEFKFIVIIQNTKDSLKKGKKKVLVNLLLFKEHIMKDNSEII